MYLIDKMAEKKPDVGEEVVDQLLLKQLLNELEANERKLIYLRFFQNKKQVEVAQIMGITQVQVSRLEKKILLSMRRKAEEVDC
jgi:RNA polymerase sporulation-specific sigma factor